MIQIHRYVIAVLILLVTAIFLCVGCSTHSWNENTWSASTSMALAVSTVPAGDGIWLPFTIKSIKTPSGGSVTIRCAENNNGAGAISTQKVTIVEESSYRMARWVNYASGAGRAASQHEKQAIVNAFLWLQLRGIHENEFEVNAITDAHGQVSILLQCIPYQPGGHYLFRERSDGYCIGP